MRGIVTQQVYRLAGQMVLILLTINVLPFIQILCHCYSFYQFMVEILVRELEEPTKFLEVHEKRDIELFNGRFTKEKIGPVIVYDVGQILQMIVNESTGLFWRTA